MKKLAEESEKVLKLSKKDRDTFTKKIESLELELQETKDRLQGEFGIVDGSCFLDFSCESSVVVHF